MLILECLFKYILLIWNFNVLILLRWCIRMILFSLFILYFWNIWTRAQITTERSYCVTACDLNICFQFSSRVTTIVWFHITFILKKCLKKCYIRTTNGCCVLVWTSLWSNTLQTVVVRLLTSCVTNHQRWVRHAWHWGKNKDNLISNALQ